MHAHLEALEAVLNGELIGLQIILSNSKIFLQFRKKLLSFCHWVKLDGFQ